MRFSSLVQTYVQKVKQKTCLCSAHGSFTPNVVKEEEIHLKANGHTQKGFQLILLFTNRQSLKLEDLTPSKGASASINIATTGILF